MGKEKLGLFNPPDVWVVPIGEPLFIPFGEKEEDWMFLPKLDAKFSGVIFKIKDGSILRDDEYMVFLAHDNIFAKILPIYRDMCFEAGADKEHIDAVDRTIIRLDQWRRANTKSCKIPDAKDERLVG